MFISSAKHVARWSSCFLAFAIGFAPSAQARGIGISLLPEGESASDRGTAQNRRKRFSHRSGFSFRSVFVPPQYAGQAETPLPLSWWEQGSDSPVAIAIGNAEGTRNLDGSRTAAYYWHTDPGNAADNFGSFSFQHFRPHEKAPVQRQQGTDNKRWVSARRALPEVADRRQMQRLRRFHDQLLAQAKVHRLELSTLELLNGLDLANQSELAALDTWGYIDRLNQAKQMYSDPDEQILQARTWSYWHPTQHHWDAPGLGNTQASITRDQRRRANAVKQVLAQAQQKPSLLERINRSTLPKRRRGSDPNRDGWTLRAFQSAPQSGAGFVEQPLQVETEQQPLLELLQETQTAIRPPEQQADIALAEALAFDESQADDVAAEILAVETEVELLLSQQPVTADETLANASGAESALESVPALAPNWEAGLLMASTQTLTEQSEVAASTEPVASEDGNTATTVAQDVAAVAVGISEQPISQPAATSASLGDVTLALTNVASPAVKQQPSTTPVATAPPEAKDTETSSGQATAISVQLPQPPLAATPAADSVAGSVKQPKMPLGQTTTLAIASPESNKQASTPSTKPQGAAATAKRPAKAPSSTKATVTTGSVSVAAVTEKSSAALANQAALANPIAKTAEPEPPELSTDALAVSKPATEAAMAAAEGLLVQHIDLAERQAAEAAARAAAARKAAQKHREAAKPEVEEPSPTQETLSQTTETSASTAEASDIDANGAKHQLHPATYLSRIVPHPKVEADQVADAIIFFEGLTD